MDLKHLPLRLTPRESELAQQLRDATEAGEPRRRAECMQAFYNGVSKAVQELLETIRYGQVVSALNTERSDHAALTVLVVDDRSFDRSIARGMLEREGHEVLDVGSGQEALAMLGRRQVDVVLLDLVMPEMDGVEVLSHIRELAEQSGREIPVICVSGFLDESERNRCLAIGALDSLAKPMDRARLNTALARATTRGQ